jgi:Zn-dependent alcohol dehydrogenase
MEGPRYDMVLVRIVAGEICHADIDFREGEVAGPVSLRFLAVP